MEEYQDNSLRGRVFRKLREDILSGVYEDQEELREITIGEEMGVSRTPVREALRQLELEGLVTIIPNKGAYVTSIKAKDVADIYHVRSKMCIRDSYRERRIASGRLWSECGCKTVPPCTVCKNGFYLHGTCNGN